ncbi:hypothetical protein ACFLTV_00085 [Chloroflexota bacterium]
MPWLIIVPGYFLGSIPTAYNMELPCLVGITHLLQTRQRIAHEA